MRKTDKYQKARRILNSTSTSQEMLYKKLNLSGWWWNSNKKEWEQDNTHPNQASELVSIRVLGSIHNVEQIAQLFIENAKDVGLKLLKKSEACLCKPPNQRNARIYLTFKEIEK